MACVGLLRSWLNGPERHGAAGRAAHRRSARAAGTAGGRSLVGRCRPGRYRPVDAGRLRSRHDRDGAGGGCRAAAAALHRHAAQGAGARRRRDDHPRHRAAQPRCGRSHRRRGGRRLPRRRRRGPPGRPRGAPRRDHHPRPQRQGRGVEQLLLAVAGPRPLRRRARCWSTATPCTPSTSSGPCWRPPGRTAPRACCWRWTTTKVARRGGDEGHPRRQRPHAPHHQADGARRGARRVHRGDADRAARRGRAGDRARGDLAARPRPLLRGRLPDARRHRRRGRRRAASATQSWVEVDNHDDLARAREIACHY